MQKEFYTYLHCKPNGDPFYVGKGTGKRSHMFANSKRNQHHKRIVAKYGRSNIGIFIFSCKSESQAHADEIQQIAQLRRDGYELANICDGGEGFSGLVFSPEHRANLSKSHMGKKNPHPGYKHSPEACAKMSEARKGDKNKSFGKKMSPETKAKLLATHEGISWSKEHRASYEEAIILRHISNNF